MVGLDQLRTGGGAPPPRHWVSEGDNPAHVVCGDQAERLGAEPAFSVRQNGIEQDHSLQFDALDIRQ
jgi:hypothetical protein